MSRRASMLISRLLLEQNRNKAFSTATLKDAAISNGASRILGGAKFQNYGIFRSAPMLEVRHRSSMASEEKAPKSGSDAAEVVVSSYWGVAPPKVQKSDGSPWRWNCFRPWETYTADISIDVTKHHEAKTFMDKFAYYTVQALKYPTYMFFQVFNLLLFFLFYICQ